jgi:hypothetical protein
MWSDGSGQMGLCQMGSGARSNKFGLDGVSSDGVGSDGVG